MSLSRGRVLNELGLGPQWRLRDEARAADASASELDASAAVPAQDVSAQLSERSAERNVERGVEPIPAALPAASPAAGRFAVIAASPAAVGRVEAERLNWDELSQSVSSCRACALCEARKQAVLGVGARQADWLFVGEGPGADEDEYGEPFVGPAGKLLDAMLAAIDIQRGENVYIANAVKCFPPNNRKPEPEEIATCRPYLQRQIELLQPKLIVALGRAAAQTLLQQEVKIGVARGQLFDYKGIPLIVTYHPAYLLSNPHDKAKAWEDLCLARRSMR